MAMKTSDHTDKFVNVCCSSPTEFEADDTTEAEVATNENSHNNEKRLDYGIEDTPAFYLCFIFGLQVNYLFYFLIFLFLSFIFTRSCTCCTQGHICSF